MIKVGTDFSGIGSPEAALKRLKLPHHNIFACDIDKYAEKSFLELNNPDKFYRDITTRDYKEVPKLDLYVAGFPCQSFSLAGKRKGFDETRGTLFFNVAEFIKINQPECFILENVKGLLSHDSGKTFQTITDVLTNGGGTLNGQMGMDSIEDGLGYHVYTKVLNTKDYGIPQNRERIFIVGFRNWREFRFPKELSLDITLKDLLEEDVNEKYCLSDKMIKTIFQASKGDWNSGKMTIDTNLAKTINARVFKMGRADTDNYITVHSLYPRSSKTGKCGTGHLSKEDGTTYCLDTGNNQAIEKQNKIRRLTPLECWRLQGFTDEEFYKAEKVNSDTQLYKQAGNSITVNVMVEILRKIYLS